ncbi:membrane-spanning 4-domains subfamily A member 3 [Echinops telfairi]|uniref:Membrane-spanning 4-domains subfamily A member 3 n=1 Tax=Echinops telfairi TaxID=9371 RepID=A0AC55DML9_ECHTE|nr:membrane-spanning 4-domains subfamily A member 3 [Echinops telfairi]
MASQEAGNTERRTGSGAPGSEMEPGRSSNSLYYPIDESQNVTRGELQALGAIQIMNGIIILALGIFLWAMHYEFNVSRTFSLFIFYTGYPLWGAVLFISSGSMSIAAERKNTRKMMSNSFGMNIASAINALVGTVLLSINVALNAESLRSCQLLQTPSLCVYLGLLSTGLVSLMLIFTLLELCISIFVSSMWLKANCCKSKAAVSSHLSAME